MNVQDSVIHDVEILARLLDESGWRSLHVVVPGFELRLSKDAGEAAGSVAVPAVAQGTTSPASAGPETRLVPPAQLSTAAPEGLRVVAAPTLGTFYRSPKPGQPPFVEIGQTVDAETDVCLVEVMKLFTTVRAGVRGVVRRICVEDGTLVEHGQALFFIEPVD